MRELIRPDPPLAARKISVMRTRPFFSTHASGAAHGAPAATGSVPRRAGEDAIFPAGLVVEDPLRIRAKQLVGIEPLLRYIANAWYLSHTKSRSLQTPSG
jgi:hypothetical protein